MERYPAEVMTVADDEVVVDRRGEMCGYRDLAPDTEVDLDGLTVRTLPRRGELLTTLATVNDVHFGETVCGKVDGVDDWETFSVRPGEAPYPETMSAGAVQEIRRADVDLVVAKGDLTSNGLQAEYDRFVEVYGAAFGEQLMHVRGNHESWHHLDVAVWPTQERKLDGVTVALLDTSLDGQVHGGIDADQIEWLDELGERTDQPVLVMGHHPVWNPADVPRDWPKHFGLPPEPTEALAAVMARRPSLVGYFAGHTHRNKVVWLADAPSVPFVEVASVKDFPGSWAEYRVFDGAILQVHRRISTPAALDWSERTRAMFGGSYEGYSLGGLDDRCFMIDTAGVGT